MWLIYTDSGVEFPNRRRTARVRVDTEMESRLVAVHKFEGKCSTEKRLGDSRHVVDVDDHKLGPLLGIVAGYCTDIRSCSVKKAGTPTTDVDNRKSQVSSSSFYLGPS